MIDGWEHPRAIINQGCHSAVAQSVECPLRVPSQGATLLMWVQNTQTQRHKVVGKKS